MTGAVLDLFDRSTSTLRFDDGTVASSAELVDQGRRWATVLRSEGFEPGDRLAVHLRNGPDFVRSLLAAAAADLVAVAVNTRYAVAEVDDLVARSGARTLPVDERWRAAAPFVPTGGAASPFVVFTTSGTTSRPKMVLHVQRSIAMHAAEVAAAFRYSARDTVLVAMPLCGTFGLASLAGAIAGDAEVIVTDFDLDRTVSLLARHAVTALNGSDDMFHRLLTRCADLSSVRLGGYARFNSSLDGVVAVAERAGATLTGLYGMSEVQALFSLRDPTAGADERCRPGGTLVSPTAGYRVVGGELQVRGPSLMAGYLAEGGEHVDVGLTATHVSDGWFRTGDLAEPEGDRSFEYRARLGDAMRLGGFLVDPSEIESVLATLPGVEAAEVVAVDRPDGARPVAFVIGGVDEPTAIAACRDRLAIHKVPVRVVSIDAFPTTPSANGTKIRRGELRDRASALLFDGG